MEAELQKIVRVYLKSTKGKEYLGRKEFQTLVSSQFSNMLTEADSKDAVDNMSKSLDSDQDGKVGFDEYMKLVGYLACSLSQQRALDTSANNTASEPQSGAGNQAEVKPEVKVDVKPDVKAEVKPEVKPEVKVDVKPEVKVPANAETTAEAKGNAEPKVDVKVEVNPEVKPEVKLEVKPEAKMEVKVEPAATATTATEVEQKEADVMAKVELAVAAAAEEKKPAPAEEGVEKKTNEAAS